MRKIRKRSNLNFKLIALIVIFFVAISIGYSYLQAQLKIEGKATITMKEQEISYPRGNSTGTYKITKYSSQSDSDYTTYDVTLNIVNNDEEINLWKIEFNMPQTSKNMFCDYNYKYNNGKVIINYKKENEIISKGSTQTINFQIDTGKDEKFTIKNLTLNGLLVDINAL